MPTLELSMIVKNGAGGLARCLASVRGVADRITLGDTGSTDDTVAIALAFGATIVPVAWRDDFAAARNAVLAQAVGDWVLFLDADEMLDPAAAMEIPRLMADPGVAGYDVTTWNYVMDAGFRSSGEQARGNPMVVGEAGAYPKYFPSGNTRLFRRDPRVYFEHCVHETVGDRIDTLGLRRRAAKFVIHHFGYVEDGAGRRAQKDGLYYELALKKVACAPDSYQAILGAGIAELDHAKRAAVALPYFERAIALGPAGASGWVYAGICLTRLGRHGEALTHLRRAIGLDPGNMLAASTVGDVCFQRAEYGEARRAYERAVELGDGSALTQAKLGAAEVHLGESDAGMARVEAAVRGSPESGELCDIYATAAFLAGRCGEACAAARRRLGMKDVSAFHFLLAATLHRHSGRDEEAQGIVENGVCCFPDDGDLRNMMGKRGDAGSLRE